MKKQDQAPAMAPGHFRMILKYQATSAKLQAASNKLDKTAL